MSSCEQNMAGRKKYSLKDAVDLVLQADSDSGSEPDVNSSKWQVSCHMSRAFAALTKLQYQVTLTLHLSQTLGRGWGDGRGVNIWGGRGFLRVMVYWYISNRLDGCVCNIRMPSVHQNHENAISGHCVLY